MPKTTLAAPPTTWLDLLRASRSGLSRATQGTEAVSAPVATAPSTHGRGPFKGSIHPEWLRRLKTLLRVGSIRYRARLYRQGFPIRAANAGVATNRQGPGSTHPDARVERHEC